MSISENNDLSFAGRVRGLVHGVAFGDAMGAPIEKLPVDEIRARYGFVDSLVTAWHRDGQGQDTRKGRVCGNGIVTDDTLMTLALMNVYNDVARHIDAWDMADGMVRQIAWTPRWIPELQRDAALIERLFYPEKWIFQRHQLSARDPRQGGIGNMVNCGAAMYIVPVGAINACDPRAAYDEAIAFASGHQQSFGLEAAGVLAGAVAAAFVPDTDIGAVVAVAYDLARDGTRDAIGAIAEVAEQLRASGAEHQQVVAVFHDTIRRFSPMGDDVNHTAGKVGRASPGYQPSRQHSIEELPLALGFALLAMHGAAVLDPDDAALLDRANRLDLNAEAARFARTGLRIMQADRDRTATVLTDREHLTR